MTISDLEKQMQAISSTLEEILNELGMYQCPNGDARCSAVGKIDCQYADCPVIKGESCR